MTRWTRPSWSSMNGASSHSIYKKSVRRQTKFYAHDEENRCSLGDTVRIIESRPYSKTKRWKVAEILSSIEIADVQPGADPDGRRYTLGLRNVCRPCAE